MRACLRDGASWRGESAIRYLGGLGPAVEICEGCDLFVEGSYDAAFEGVTAVFYVAAVLGNSSSNQPLVSRAPDPATCPAALDTVLSPRRAVFVYRSSIVCSLCTVQGAGNVADDTYRGGVVGTQNVLSSIEKSSTVRRLVYTSSLAASHEQLLWALEGERRRVDRGGLGVGRHETLSKRPGRLVQHHHRL